MDCGGGRIKYEYMSLLTNIVSYYKFDVDESDATGNGNNPSSINGLTISGPNGKINSGLGMSVAGSSRLQYSYIPQSGSGDFSVGFWINTMMTPIGFGTFINWGDNSGNSFYVRLTSTGNIQATFDSSNGLAITTNAFNDGNFHYVVVLYKSIPPSSHALFIYVDGVSADTGTQSLYTATVSGSLLYVGERFNGASDYTGSLDEMGLWSRELSTTEITQLYNSGAGLQYPFTGIIPSNGFFELI